MRASLPEHTQLNEHLRAWLCSGRCQAPSGAFLSWVDPTGRHPGFEYPEITGYALTCLANLPDRASQETDSGRAGAQWLIRRLSAGRLAARDGWDSEAVYNFDLAMMSSGLITFGTAAGIAEAVEAGVGLAASLADQVDRGGLPPIAATGARSRRVGWSVNGRAHMLKAVQCLLLAAEFDGERFAACARRVIESGLSWQDQSGRFVTDPATTETMLHPHLYAAEGLWVWGVACDDSEAVGRARMAVDWAMERQLPTGGLPRSDAPGAPEQLDATCQAIRLGNALGSPQAPLLSALARVVEVSYEPESGLAAIGYQPGSPDPHLNTWVTLFGMQALGGVGEPMTWNTVI